MKFVRQLFRRAREKLIVADGPRGMRAPWGNVRFLQQLRQRYRQSNPFRPRPLDSPERRNELEPSS